jgi:hypothetical protein
MSKAELLMAKGILTEFPPEQQELITQCKTELREVMAKYEEHVAMFSVALIGLEAQAKP